MRDWPRLLDQLVRNDAQMGSSGVVLGRSDRLIAELSECLIGFDLDPPAARGRMSLPWVVTGEAE